MSTPYRYPGRYRQSKTYRGLELVPAVAPPGFAVGSGMRWQLPTPRQRVTALPSSEATARGAAIALPFEGATSAAADVALPWSRPEAQQAAVRAPWALASQQIQATAAARWGLPAPRGAAAALPWGASTPHAESLAAPWLQAQPAETAAGLRWGAALPRELHITAFWRQAAARGAYIALPWGPAGQRQVGVGTPWPIDPNPGDGSPITVPIRDAYIMLPTLTAVTLPDRTPLTLLNVRLSTDVTRYGWELGATLPFGELALVTPVGRTDPVEIEVTVNGYTWVLMVEGVDDQRRFGLKTGTIRGRSRSSLLDAPYAPARSGIAEDARDASQLADEQLFGTGWTLAWDAVDWLVPGGTWSYQDATVLQAIGQLAASIGARIETARTTLDLAVKPLYPVSPWAWAGATPYAILPLSIVPGLSSSWQGGTNANGVYVLDGAGSGAPVFITGTGGEVEAGQVVDRLLVSADPQRERGRIELAKAGKITSHSLTMLLLPSPAAPGLMPLGALLQITDPAHVDGAWRAQVMAVTIDAQRSGGGLGVRQTLTLEQHHR